MTIVSEIVHIRVAAAGPADLPLDSLGVPERFIVRGSSTTKVCYIPSLAHVSILLFEPQYSHPVTASSADRPLEHIPLTVFESTTMITTFRSILLKSSRVLVPIRILDRASTVCYAVEMLTFVPSLSLK